MKFAQTPLSRILIGSLALLLVTVLFVRFIQSTSGQDEAQSNDSRQYRARKINLALRRTAHHLLRLAGDSTSRIPAVEQPNPHTFRVSFSRSFNYDSLPALLQASLQIHAVAGPYDVAVLDCARGKLQLGYSHRDLMSSGPVPCTGRSMTAGCYVLQVTFEPLAPASPPSMRWPLIALAGLLTGVAFIMWRRSAQTSEPEVQPVSSMDSAIRFGQSQLDVASQRLMSGSSLHNLTYRETKLLRLLVSHPNELLERNQILKLVWEDEGITVGRSVDVFISRLRKLLQNDPTIRIAAVHGVGYRLEVLSEANPK
ncbi:winged helix-turn-helix domain-containing protein [Spirosoma utsteinense]|uniref:DNA-binding winged helix-turn-helix (WHTH) protein n=1 Tax=Spirosoma utsteinense TaxID=2585773 RepID=A0ABR6W6Q6_9BACT|nr:winged helix-turn-helix domain-containing protein [Spirosoma utsteinense]MBC3788560.1 DNA-binding winged helix-turn-helix (wHTH) protein [Spirosoma utsteinense]MBC3791833.1 DNA-binding winged helix-turn-helix (wHTH) protein [Spirosoma utsteinense]